MAALFGYDLGFTLWAQCDQCRAQIMVFGLEGQEGRAELEAKIRAEGWQHLGGEGWHCEKCHNAADTGLPASNT